jgi:hypothetical protein
MNNPETKLDDGAMSRGVLEHGALLRKLVVCRRSFPDSLNPTLRMVRSRRPQPV